MSKPTFLGPLIGKGVGQCELVNAERGSVLASHVEPAFDSKTRKKGLLGRESLAEDFAMIIAPCRAVHTFSMRVPLDLVFVARDGTVTKTCRGVKPWRIAGSMKAYAVIEAAEGFVDRHEIVPGEVVALREVPAAPEPAAAFPVRETPRAPVPTPAAGVGVTPTAHRTTRKRVTLADIVARKTPLAWFESVAIAQELCEAAIAKGPASDPRIPELKHVTLTGEGRVALLADGPGGHSPVQRTGLVLLALTPEDELPVQLRLLVLEEVSPRPRLKTLEDLHRELEFFERPDRRSIVREVLDRYQHQPASVEAEPAVPAPLLEPPPPKRHGHWWNRRSVWAGSLAGVAVIAVAVGMWLWPRPEGQWLRAEAAQLSKASLDTGKKAVQAVNHEVKAAKWNLGFRQREPERSVLVLAEAAPPRTPELGQNITLEGGATAPAVQPFHLAKTPIAAEPESAAASLSAGSERRGPAPPPDVLFSTSDRDVVPPNLLGPPLPTKAPPGVRFEDLPQYELVISAHGIVESVKLVSSRPTAQSGMQLSVLKAWRFEPATLGGYPVRYRLRVRLPE
jgi:hypothetical protein